MKYLPPYQFWAIFVLLTCLLLGLLGATVYLLVQEKNVPTPVLLFLTGTGATLAGMLLNKKPDDDTKGPQP